jgi:ATP-dependent Lhr-like helicase
LNADELHDALLLLGAMTEEEVRRSATEAWGAGLLESLRAERRAGRLSSDPSFWVAAERLPMVLAVYPDTQARPPIEPPESELKRPWERANAIRELVRGRMEACGPTTASALAQFFRLPQTEIDAALLGLEAEGFVLRGRFHPEANGVGWCDRRLLARIHRLTINRLRAEIQPVPAAEFLRFLLAWHRVDGGNRAEGLEGVGAVLELLDGYELPAAAWEPEVLALRVRDYTPQWLDQLCFTGRIGWGRLSPPQNQKARAFTPVRSSPVSFFVRDHLWCWLELSAAEVQPEFLPDTAEVLKALLQSGALFFNEIVRRTRLLPSRVEQALGELAAQGRVTADSFEGLRALLVPSEKRAPLADLERKRRHKTVTSIEFAGRWALLRNATAETGNLSLTPREEHGTRKENRSRATFAATTAEAVETYARVLLRRYGVVFRRLLERESLKVSWFELGRAYRRLEARGEIRGGYFVGGVSGEQFALPEAIGLLRAVRKRPSTGELVAISGADPLNLVGILTPGPRIAAIAANRILLRDGLPIAALEAGQIIKLEQHSGPDTRVVEGALNVGKMLPSLRRYYA